MSTIANLVVEIAERHGLRRGNGKFSGPCPECGGGGGSDRFQIRDDGGYKCYGCEIKGDIITWLRSREGKSCAEAHDLSGLPCRSVSCQHKGTCRNGDGSGRKPVADTRRHLQPQQQAAAKTLPVSEKTSPQDIWHAWATPLVDQAATALAGSADIIAWLTNRGIGPAAIDRFKLGWLEHDRRVLRKSIGLPPKDKDRLWIPGGLLIPTMADDGSIYRLRIRRTDSDREKFLKDLKYVWIEGSGNAPMNIQPLSGKARAAVIVEAELDAMAVADAHQEVMVIALGTVRAGIDQSLRRLLADCPVILVALDADPGVDKNRPGAGPAAISTWLHEYRQAKYWPTPAGKDPGEYVIAGGDLRAWIEAGLPPVSPSLKIIQPHQDPALMPDCCQQGDGGESLVGDVITMTLVDGRVVYVTEDRVEWDRLVAAGEVVFSGNEMRRLAAACRGMNAAERGLAALKAVAIKQVFSGAYIRRGAEL